MEYLHGNVTSFTLVKDLNTSITAVVIYWVNGVRDPWCSYTEWPLGVAVKPSANQNSERARGHDVIVGVFSRWRWTVAHECIYAVAGVPLLQPNLEGFQSSSATLTSKDGDIIFVLDPRNEHVTSG